MTKFGDNPDPTEMNSPEKKKYSKILFDRADVVMGYVNQAMNRLVKVNDDIQQTIKEANDVQKLHDDTLAEVDAGLDAKMQEVIL